MKLARVLTAAALVLTVGACSDDGTGPGDTDNDSMEGSVQGEAAWDPPATSIQGIRSGTTLTVSGVHTSGGKTIMVQFILLNAVAADEFDLNPNLAGQFGSITITQGSNNSTWTTVLPPSTGTVDLNILTADRAAGTFTFNGQAVAGTNATGQKAVTSGTFDVRF